MYLGREQGQFKSMQWQHKDSKWNLFMDTQNSCLCLNTQPQFLFCKHIPLCSQESQVLQNQCWGDVSWRDPWLNVPLITPDPLFHLPYLVIWVVYSEVAHTNDDFVQQSFTGMLGAVPQQGADNVPEGQGQSFSSHNRLKNRPRNRNEHSSNMF